MLSLVSRQWVSRGCIIAFLFLIIYSTGVISTAPTNVDAATESDDPVEILLLLDSNWGANVPFIIYIYERFGWSITTTGLNETLTSCEYLNYDQLTVDVLMTEISDLSQFDVISIMPGNSHDLLRTNQTSLDLINAAVDQGLIVSAWCRGVRVLAAADVIDGKNITGNADYIAEYEAAGATFNELVPPIIDGNIVTGVRSRFYRDAMCQAIATAVGVYETDAPVFVSSTVTPQPSAIGTAVNLTVELSDVTGVYSVQAKVYALNDLTGERISEIFVQNFALAETSTDDVFTAVVEDLDVGNYTVDFDVWDGFLNEITFSDGANLLIVDQLTTPGSPLDPMQWVIPGAMVGTAGVVVLVIFLRRR